MIGSGGLVVMDETPAWWRLPASSWSSPRRESCGKCVPCREGTKRMLEILDRIIDNKGTLEDLDLLEELRTPSARPPCAAWDRAPASLSRAR